MLPLTKVKILLADAVLANFDYLSSPTRAPAVHAGSPLPYEPFSPLSERSAPPLKELRLSRRTLNLLPDSFLGFGSLTSMSNSLRIASQCAIDGPEVPSDHSWAKTIKIVTRSSGSLTAMIGEPSRLAPQLFVASPETKNMTCGCQFVAWSFKYCCFDIM